MSQRERAIALGAALRESREKAGLSQEEVARRVDLPPLSYGSIERGRLLPSVSTLTRLCVVLKIDPDNLPDLQDVRD